jgi:hypothetical protein
MNHEWMVMRTLTRIIMAAEGRDQINGDAGGGGFVKE